ncbi:lysozyme inhibitor LprI family protein [Undibacterium sp. TJN25]|uniref:lysozyme inhibitor LprI family protein n=1 Tax=Undibacterium sp. TJN25 TaxID=3413056 RepID=UPI003BF0518F
MNKLNAFKIALLLLPLSASAASFDCKKSSTPVEKTICANPSLDKLDQEIADTYGKLLASVDDPLRRRVKEVQRNWLKDRKDARQLDATMRARLEALRGAVVSEHGLSFLRLQGTERPMYLLSKLPGTAAYNQWVDKTWQDASGETTPAEAQVLIKKCKSDDDCDIDSISRSYAINFASPELISVHESVSDYMYRAAHPSNQDTHYNWWLSKAGSIKPAEIFSGQAYKKVVEKYARQYVATLMETKPDGVQNTGSATEPDNWAITKKALHITGQGYDYMIGRGFVEFDIPWTAFSGMLNPAFSSALNK